MEIVSLKNRTSKDVKGRFDGQVITIPAHGAKSMLSHAAELVKRQNPLMGSEDMNDLRSPQFLLGVEEWGDDVSPIEQSACEERFDRSLVNDLDGQKAKPMRMTGGKGSRMKVALDDDNPVGIQTA